MGLSDSGVYAITNATNGKFYVGSSRSVRKRWAAHRRLLNAGIHDNAKLQRAWSKYGADVFSFALMLRCDASMCLDYEQRVIDAFDTTVRGYNINPVAAKPPDATGRVVSDATRQLLSAAHTGRKHTPEHIEKMRQSKLGGSASTETRRKMSEARKGIPHSQAWREAIGNANRGRMIGPPSDEHRDKVSRGNKGKIRTPEQRLRYSMARRRVVEAKRIQKESQA